MYRAHHWILNRCWTTRERLQNGERTRQAARTVIDKKKQFQTDREELANKFAFAKRKSKGKGIHHFIPSYLLNNLNVIFFTIFRHPRSMLQGYISLFWKGRTGVPHSTEFRRMADGGLGYRFNVKFPKSATSKDIRAIFYREFPRFKEAHAFYVCAKGPGTSTKLCIKNYSVPSGQEIK